MNAPIVAKAPKPGTPWADQIRAGYRAEGIPLAGDRPGLIELTATATTTEITITATTDTRTVSITLDPDNITGPWIKSIVRIIARGLIGFLLATTSDPDMPLPPIEKADAWSAICQLGLRARITCNWDQLDQLLLGNVREENLV